MISMVKLILLFFMCVSLVLSEAIDSSGITKKRQNRLSQDFTENNREKHKLLQKLLPNRQHRKLISTTVGPTGGKISGAEAAVINIGDYDITVDEDLEGKNSITDHMYDIYNDEDETYDDNYDDDDNDDDDYNEDDDYDEDDDDEYYEEGYYNDDGYYDDDEYDEEEEDDSNDAKNVTLTEKTVIEEIDEDISKEIGYIIRPIYIGIMIGSAGTTFFVVLSLFYLCRNITRGNQKAEKDASPFDEAKMGGFVYNGSTKSPIVKDYQQVPSSMKDYMLVESVPSSNITYLKCHPGFKNTLHRPLLQ